MQNLLRHLKENRWNVLRELLFTAVWVSAIAMFARVRIEEHSWPPARRVADPWSFAAFLLFAILAWFSLKLPGKGEGSAVRAALALFAVSAGGCFYILLKVETKGLAEYTIMAFTLAICLAFGCLAAYAMTQGIKRNCRK